MAAGLVPPAPFLRPMGEGQSIPAVPEGWETHPAGSIAGDLMAVAYDPVRHDVAMVWDSCFPKEVADGVKREGWNPLVRTDDAQIWSRDRLAPARQLLAAVGRIDGSGAGVGR